MLLIAIERVQDALVLAMEAAIRKGLKNVFFVSLDAANIDQFFDESEIDLLYINFCDPWPRKKNAKRRLTYHSFREKYKKGSWIQTLSHAAMRGSRLFLLLILMEISPHSCSFSALYQRNAGR